MLEISAMSAADYDEAMAFWQSLPELGVAPRFDTRERITAYLARNPGLSTIARQSGRVVGTVLCGHDGRRGSLYHVGVAPDLRGQGVAQRMLARSTALLKEAGVGTAFLLTSEDSAAAFWQHNGWQKAPGITYHSKQL